MVDTGQVIGQISGIIVPAAKVLVLAVCSFAIIIGLWYYFFIYLRMRKWHITIKEQKADGKLHTIGTDVLRERKTGFLGGGGKKIYYRLDKGRTETTPPPDECVDRIGKKDFATYIRLRTTYVPLLEKMDQDVYTETRYKLLVVRLYDKAVAALRTGKYGTTQKVNERFVYVPVSYVPHIKVGYHTMDYDIDMMRMNTIDNLDDHYKQRQNFWQQYGHLIIIGLLVMSVIIVTYFSFEYAQNVIKQTLDKTDATVSSIDRLVNRIGSGGITPPA